MCRAYKLFSITSYRDQSEHFTVRQWMTCAQHCVMQWKSKANKPRQSNPS